MTKSIKLVILGGGTSCIETIDLIKALKIYKRYAKKMAKNLKRYSDQI